MPSPRSCMDWAYAPSNCGPNRQALTGRIDTGDTLDQVGRRGRDGLVEEGGPSVRSALAKSLHPARRRGTGQPHGYPSIGLRAPAPVTTTGAAVSFDQLSTTITPMSRTVPAICSPYSGWLKPHGGGADAIRVAATG